MTKRPDHLPPDCYGERWEPLFEPTSIDWSPSMWGYDIDINGIRVGWLSMRPAYCDRGRVQINCELPDIDGADMFPRYYMDVGRAREEFNAFLRYRLWRLR